MVLKFLTSFVFLGILANVVMASQGLRLFMTRTSNSSCQKRIEVFLEELRSIMGDDPIELEFGSQVSTAQRRAFVLSCDDRNEIFLKGEGTDFHFRYLEKSKGFSAEDWLTFQKGTLRPNGDQESALTLSELAPAAKAFGPEQQNALLQVKEPLQISGWAYGLGGALVLGGLATAAYFLWFQNPRGPTVDVQ